jgi:hypothetical protein
MAQGLTPLLLCAQIAGGAAPPQSPVSYRLVASLAPDGNHITAQAVVDADRAVLGIGDSVHIGLGGRDIRLRLTAPPLVNGRSTSFTMAPDSTEIALPLTAEPALRIELQYRLALDTAIRRQLGYDLFSGTEDDWVWYPTLQHVADSARRFSDFDVDLTAPRGVTVLLTGVVRDSTLDPAGVRRHAVAAHVEGFALALAPGFVVSTARGSGIVVHAISPAADSAVFRAVAEAAAHAASWYHDTYGFFPVSQMGIIPGASRSRGGFPLPNVFMIHRGDLSPGFVRWITAHELAHYYWGLHVLGSSERLDWLMLGLGIWTDELYLARTAGIPLEAQWHDPHADNSFGDFAVAQVAGYDQRLGIPSAYADSLDYDYNTYVRHAKGAIAVYLLAQLVGTDPFVELQRTLLRDFRYRPLSPNTFAQRLAAIGIPRAEQFLERWVRDDARLDYAVRGVRADSASPFRYWIEVERAGTIPYPVTVEATSQSGAAVRLSISGDSALDSIGVKLDTSLQVVRLDPDGLLPMWSSSNQETQRAFLRAMGSVGPVEPFLTLARAHLDEDADPLLAALLVERLFELGRWTGVVDAAHDFPAVIQCTDRATCLAALQVARALARLGERSEAQALLARVAPAMGAFGLSGTRRLAAARAEIGSR